MKLKLSILLCSMLPIFAQAQPTPPLSLPIPQSIPQGLPALDITSPLGIAQPIAQNSTSLQFSDITISELLPLLFNEMQSKNYVLASNVLSDQRKVTFRFSKKEDGSLEPFLITFLKSYGYQMTNQNGVFYIASILDKKPEDYSYYVFIPKNRRASYIADEIKPFFSANFIGASKSQSTALKPISTSTSLDTTGVSIANTPSPVANTNNSNVDNLTFRYETEKEKKSILSLLNQFDTPDNNVLIRAHIYEVTSTSQDGTALGLVLNIASKKLNLNLGSTDPLTNFASISTNALNLIFSNIDTDQRFKLISSPFLVTKSGQEASLTFGDTVPTYDSVSYQQNGTAVQSVKPVDTGLIFKVTPYLKGDSIDLDVNEQVSDAVQTTTGVNNTPTITKRNLSTSLTVKLNHGVMLAGLTNKKTNDTTSRPFALPWFNNKIKTQDNAEILIFIEVFSPDSQQNPPIPE
jgi:type II secretory pathway component GspD/PulD (secretin)